MGSLLRTFREVQKTVKRSSWKEVLTNAWYTGTFYPADPLIGTDEQGNKYYENKNQINTRQRYVIYSDTNAKEGRVDGSRVPAEWHAWLHYMDHHNPTEDTTNKPIFKLPHQNTALSNQGAFPNYVPPGHIVNEHAEEDYKEYTKPLYTPWNKKQV